MTQNETTRALILRTFLCGTLALASCVGMGSDEDLAVFDRVELSQRIGVEAIPAGPGPCEMCDEHSEAKQDRRILTDEGQLWLEFCSQECARTFYSNPNWRRYQKKKR